ncbi:MAG: class I SAM-dependent methyltransferase [Ardenticatenales bacterium]|nr:class I SAM-dependent methyltransferase [Ardenticatenales bacterium]MCB9171596.1 class I SAM-dependent methyltransferase [Ardenticatenales bacterium]
MTPTDAMRYNEVVTRLRTAYDQSAAQRNARGRQPWKAALRDAFAARLRQAGATRLVEFGAGPGYDSAFFHEMGLSVVAIDPSPEMVRFCREKGVASYVGDYLHHHEPDGSADALWAMNSLLHVSNEALPDVLWALHRLLRPDGLFFLCVYGGDDEEGLSPFDHHQPPRFFSFRSDETLRAMLAPYFEIVEFTILNDGTSERSQALTLRRRGEATE